MKSRNARLLAWAAATGATLGLAQQPAPHSPDFAPSNLEPKGVRSMSAACAICHGTDGRAAAGSSIAGLAGRPKDEIVKAMAQYKSGERSATVMQQIARGYSDEETAAMAEYFAGRSR